MPVESIFKALEEKDNQIRIEKLKTAIVELSAEQKEQTDPGRINTKNRRGQSPLMICMEHSDLACVKLLLEAKADVNDKNVLGNTVLMTAVSHGNADAVKLLISADVDLHAHAKHFNRYEESQVTFTALDLAIDKKDLVIIRALVEAKANIDVVKEEKILNLVVAKHDLDLLDMLTEGDSNRIHEAFIFSAKYGYSDIIEKLLPSVRTSPDIIKHAIEKARTYEIFKLLLPHASLSKPELIEDLCRAVAAGHEEMIDKMLELKADINEISKSRDLIQLAAASGSIACVKKLIAAKASINVKPKGYATTALVEATLKNDIECVKVLLQAKANPDQESHFNEEFSRNDYGTPMILAAKHGYIDTIKVLIDKKANLNVNAYHGTALMHAAAKGYADIVELLIDTKADLHKTNSDRHLKPPRWHTALSLAEEEGHAECVSLLQNALAQEKIVRQENWQKSWIYNVFNPHTKEYKDEAQLKVAFPQLK